MTSPRIGRNRRGELHLLDYPSGGPRRGDDRRRALDRALRVVVIDQAACHAEPVSPEAVRRTCEAIAHHSDGAGFAWPSVETIREHTGDPRAVVFRTLRVLRSGDEPLIESWPVHRSAESAARRRLSAQDKRGNRGANLYRLGVSLRAAAGLRHPDPGWESLRPFPTAENGSVRRPTESVETDHETASAVGDETASETRETASDETAYDGHETASANGPHETATPTAHETAYEQAKSTLGAVIHETAEPWNQENLSPTGGDVDLQPPEVDLAPARANPHPGDLLAAELLAAFPEATEVEHDDLPPTIPTAILRCAVGTITLRRQRSDEGGRLDVARFGAGLDNTPCAGAREAAT